MTGFGDIIYGGDGACGDGGWWTECQLEKRSRSPGKRSRQEGQKSSLVRQSVCHFDSHHRRWELENEIFKDEIFLCQTGGDESGR